MQEENSISTKEKEKEEKDEGSEKELCAEANRTLEEDRRPMLDHHWAVPRKDRNTFSIDDDSSNFDKVMMITIVVTEIMIVYSRLMRNQPSIDNLV